MKTMHITSVLVLAASGLFAAAETGVSYPSGGETIHGKLYTPPGAGPFPGLIVIHPRTGLSDWLKEQASKLSDLGFVTLAVDLFRGKIPDNSEEWAPVARSGRPERDVQATAAFLRSQPNVKKDAIGSIGWCMGGTYSFNLATIDPALKVAVIHFPTKLPDESAILEKVNARVLGIFAGKDTVMSLKDARLFEERMKSLDKKIEIVVYPDAGHAFEMPGSATGFRPDDSADAWKRTAKFLVTYLK